MAKLFSSVSEATALKGLCSRDPKISGYLISQLREDYFHNSEAKEVFTYINEQFTKHGEIPPFRILCQSLKVSEDAREFLQTGDLPNTSSHEGAEKLVRQLDEFRRTRGLYTLGTKLLRKLEEPKIDVESLTTKVGEALARLSSRRTTENDIIHLGRDSNALAIIEEMIYGEDTDQCIPTGFKTFDDVNGGFFRGSLVVLGSTSGGGKSLIANQLNMNQARMGYKSLMVPLEMTVQENFARTISNLANLNPTDVLLKRIASGEQDLAWKRMKRLDREIASKNGRMTLFKPKEDLTMESLMSAIHSFNSDVVYIDYIGLLAGADGDDQWRKLGQIARFGKIYAEMHNKVVVLLCQLSDEGKVRYSQAIKEHASLAWVWVATKDSREKGFMNVELLKARNQNMSPFTLKIDYAHMRVSDLEPQEMENLKKEQEQKSRQSSNKSDDGFKPKKKVDMDNESDFIPDMSK